MEETSPQGKSEQGKGVVRERRGKKGKEKGEGKVLYDKVSDRVSYHSDCQT